MNPEPVIDQRRRAVLKGASAAAVLLVAGAPPALAAAAAADPWLRAQSIIDKFAKPLAFPDRSFDITAFGAKPCALAPVSGYTGELHAVVLQAPAPGATDCYPAIRAAIAATNKAGGGRVLIPAGNWYCKGPIVLLSNVNVHLAKGAQVCFSANPADYARDGEYDCGANGKLSLSRWQGNDCLNYSSMVYAHKQRNIAITGEDWTSVLNGQAGLPFEDGSGSCWWGMSGRRPPISQLRQNVVNAANPAALATLAPQLTAADQVRIQGTHADWRTDEKYLPALSEARVPADKRVFGIGHYLRPSMIEFVDCTDVLMQDYQVIETPFWQHHPINCRNVHLSRVKMESLGANSDGFDPESCDTVLVDGCLFNTGDDCIAIKAGKNTDVQYGPTRNVVIQNSIMNSGHGAITLGSEMAAGIEHVYAQHLEIRNMHWASDPLGTAIRMKTNMNRGGFLRHFYLRDLVLANGVKTTSGFYTPLPGSPIAPKSVSTSGGAVITIDCDYTPAFDSVRTRPPEVSNVHISNVRVANVQTGDGAYSCYQAFVMLGPVAHSYNGPAGATLLPLTDISISDCDFGTPRNADKPWYVYNVQRLALNNVKIGAQRYTTSISA